MTKPATPDAHSRQRRHAVRGFSLIELMVVMVIVGIASAAISLSVAPDPARALRREARDLALRFAAAQNEARLDGRVIAWEADASGYRFMRGSWQLPPGSAIPVVSTAGALDGFARDDVLGPMAWRDGPVAVVPARPVRLTAEPLGAPWQIALHRAGVTVVIERDAAGTYLLR
jgi:general secretion pathway protein H